MASFTDEILQFSPYIQEIPVEDYVRVGMIKQQQYEQGVQRIQAAFDTLNGINIVHPGHARYFGEKMAALKSEVEKSISSDFSSKQLQNQLLGMASSISSDPRIYNAILDSEKIKAESKKLEEARASGEGYGVENEDFFLESLNSYYNDSSPTAKFRGEYIRWVDVNKKIVEAIKTVDPTSTLEQMPYETDASGNVIYENGVPKLSYAMIERKISGKDRDTIALAIRSALTPEDLRQLQITGRYKLKHASREEIAENLVARTEKKYRNQILYKHDILEKLALNPEGEYKEMLERNLGEVEEFLGKIENDLRQEIRTILSTEDFDGYKSNFYSQNLIEDITNAFSSKTTEEKLVANPILNGYIASENLRLAQERARREREKEDENDPSKTPGVRVPISTEGADEFYSEVALREQINALKDSKNAAIDEVLRSVYPDTNLNEEALAVMSGRPGEEGDEEALIAAYKEQRFDNLLKVWEENGTVPPHLNNLIKSIRELRQDYEIKEEALNRIIEEADEMFSMRAGNKYSDIFKPTTINLNGQIINLSAEDMYALARLSEISKGAFTKKQNNPEIQKLKNTLENSLGREVATPLMMTVVANSTFIGPISSLEALSKGMMKQMLSGGAYRAKYDIWEAEFNNRFLPTGLSEDFDEQIRKYKYLTKTDNFKERAKYISEKIEEAGALGWKTRYEVDTYTPEQEKRVTANVRMLLADVERMGEGNQNPNFDYETFQKVVNAEKVSYTVNWIPAVDNRAERFILEASSSEGNAEMDISRESAQRLANRTFKERESIWLTKIRYSPYNHTNKSSVAGPEGAFFNKADFPKVNRYIIKADVIKEPTSDVYHPRIYVKASASDRWEIIDLSRFLPGMAGQTPMEIDALFSNLEDITIQAALAEKQRQKK